MFGWIVAPSTGYIAAIHLSAVHSFSMTPASSVRRSSKYSWTNCRHDREDGIDPCIEGRFRRFSTFLQTFRTDGAFSSSSTGPTDHLTPFTWFWRVLMIARTHSLPLLIIRSVVNVTLVGFGFPRAGSHTWLRLVACALTRLPISASRG